VALASNKVLLCEFPEGPLNKNEGREPQILPNLAPKQNILSTVIPTGKKNSKSKTIVLIGDY